MDKKVKPSMLHWIIFPPPDWTGNLSFRNRVSCLHLQSCTGIKDRSAFVRQIWRSPTAKMERKREWNLGNRKPPGSVQGCSALEDIVDGEVVMVSRGSPAPPLGPEGLDFGHLPLFHKCLKAVFAFVFFLIIT